MVRNNIFGVDDLNRLHIDLTEAELIEKSLKQNSSNKLSDEGALTIKTGNFTGRAANDKYVVEDEFTEKVIDWKNNINRMTQTNFSLIKEKIIESFNKNINDLYIVTKSVCAEPRFALKINFITTTASHALFCTNIFRDVQNEYPLGCFNIYHAPDFVIDDSQNLSLKAPTVIAINFSTREIIIIGTGYAGEIKKAVFSVLNTLLPEYDVLPMHAGANIDKNKMASLFFGLSGTGKTTLSTDIEVEIIGDDEHGMSEFGLFNFEGGCYAKTFGLSQDKEPDIYRASNRFKSLLENVVIDPVTRKPDFNNKTITENGRATYSLKALNHRAKDSRSDLPSNIFFLSADAMGVLPAVSLLSDSQAMHYFLLGYTAKLAGTEIGLKSIEIAFSHCFGAPFMMRRPDDYANLLRKRLSQHPIKVWLINTGWYGGIYGKGSRYPLSFTRNCIRSIQNNNEVKNFFYNDIFKLKIPDLVDSDKHFLMPDKLWKDDSEYKETANLLKNKFEENFIKYSHLNIGSELF